MAIGQEPAVPAEQYRHDLWQPGEDSRRSLSRQRDERRVGDRMLPSVAVPTPSCLTAGRLHQAVGEFAVALTTATELMNDVLTMTRLFRASTTHHPCPTLTDSSTSVTRHAIRTRELETNVAALQRCESRIESPLRMCNCGFVL